MTNTATVLKLGSLDVPVVGGQNKGLAMFYWVGALGGSNPTAVVSGLTTILAGVACVDETALSSSGLGTIVLTTDISSGTLNVYAWKAGGAGNATLQASTGNETIQVIGVGTV